MTRKKRKKLIKEENAYDPEELADLGIFDDGENDEDFDEKEA